MDETGVPLVAQVGVTKAGYCHTPGDLTPVCVSGRTNSKLGISHQLLV